MSLGTTMDSDGGPISPLRGRHNRGRLNPSVTVLVASCLLALTGRAASRLRSSAFTQVESFFPAQLFVCPSCSALCPSLPLVSSLYPLCLFRVVSGHECPPDRCYHADSRDDNVRREPSESTGSGSGLPVTLLQHGAHAYCTATQPPRICAHVLRYHQQQLAAPVDRIAQVHCSGVSTQKR